MLCALCSLKNNPHLLSPIGNRSVNVGDTLYIELIASDPDGDDITFDAIGKPEGSKWAPIISQIKQDCDFDNKC